MRDDKAIVVFSGGSAGVEDGLQSESQCGYGVYPAIRCLILYIKARKRVSIIYGVTAI